MGDRSVGLLRNQAGHPGKFQVRRTDGKDDYGDKHHGCEYFVLDLNHDPHGRVATLAYADSCERDGYELLARDLRLLVAKHTPAEDR